MAAAIEHFEWNHVVLLSSKTTYGTNGARDFRQAVNKINAGRSAAQPKIEIVHSIEFEGGNSRTTWTQLDRQLTAARDQNRKARKCNVFIIFAHSIALGGDRHQGRAPAKTVRSSGNKYG